MILHEFGTCKIDFLYIRYYLAAKIDFMRKPILAAPDPQTKMGCPRIDSKTMMATARRVTLTMATAQRVMARQDTTTTTMATGNDENDDGDGATGDGATGDDDDDDCDERRRRRWRRHNGRRSRQ